jgi:hypothetical protein
MHIVKASFLLCLTLAISACAQDRYVQNMRDVSVSKWTHLTAADREQIVHLVSVKTRQPIQGITRWKPDSEQIAVFTGFTDADIYVNPWTEFQLEKRANGWNIVGQDIITPGMASILLSYPPNDTQKPKKT